MRMTGRSEFVRTLGKRAERAAGVRTLRSVCTCRRSMEEEASRGWEGGREEQSPWWQGQILERA